MLLLLGQIDCLTLDSKLSNILYFEPLGGFIWSYDSSGIEYLLHRNCRICKNQYPIEKTLLYDELAGIIFY